MDDRMIEEGLKRIRRSVEKEELEKTQTNQAQEQVEHETARAVLTEEEEAQQNARIKAAHPNDVCPVCGTHVVDARYLVDPGMSAVVCGVCHVMFMPQSRYDLAVNTLKSLQQKQESPVAIPIDSKRVVVPKIVPMRKKI